MYTFENDLENPVRDGCSEMLRENVMDLDLYARQRIEVQVVSEIRY